MLPKNNHYQSYAIHSGHKESLLSLPVTIFEYLGISSRQDVVLSLVGLGLN